MLTPLLSLPAPDFLAEAFGYHRGMRFVAFWWERDSDELCYTDGRIAVCGAASDAWLTYLGHPKINTYLKTFNLGNFTTSADHTLVFDRKNNRLHISLKEQVKEFLKGENISLVEKNTPFTISIDQIMSRQRIREEREREEEMHYRLEEWLSTL